MAASTLLGNPLNAILRTEASAVLHSHFSFGRCLSTNKSFRHSLSLDCRNWKFSSDKPFLPCASLLTDTSSILRADEAVVDFCMGRRKATEVAHAIWRSIVQKGDAVVDATCGNGHDTLALHRMVADESSAGVVYGMDIQQSALESTYALLDASASPTGRELVKLFHICHSKMESVVPKDTPIKLVAFNLGYLPGGDKAIITQSETTLLALEAAGRIIQSGGLISVLVYVGHPGGRDEYEIVQSFASNLPADLWFSCKFEVTNKPSAPVLILIYKK